MIGQHESRPWGSWDVLDEGPGYKVKRIVVRPGQRLSYQTHEHRAELWNVVAGRATCVVDGQQVVAAVGESVRVEARQAHRITNMDVDDLVIIEVQLGSYCGEDDICRLDDDYGRVPA
ncbi:phosphomannose isomerase type II C-terminal cupin domain [Nocardioides plantarum]|uniref:Phosphomannose isomerase type II C-terminal cupin domain n=1 Tax=Nocardioides plantarum TaxID=29299 RepID=A0ABV5K6H5_9ACTN|nr:phosphomannose isomerase type II C-terminal cupin domain [Nocardioides plantarum]